MLTRIATIFVLAAATVSVAGLTYWNFDTSPSLLSHPEDSVGHGTTPNGSALRIDDVNTSWIDIAWAVTNDTEIHNVRANVSATWELHGRANNTPHWLCGFYGVEPTKEDGAPSAISCIVAVEDTMWEVGGQVGPVAAEQTVPDVLCTTMCDSATLSLSLDTFQNVLPYRYFDPSEDVVHFVVVAGGLEPSQFRANVAWTGVDVESTRGPFDDTYTYTPEDFDSTLFARADTPVGGPHVQYDAKLVTRDPSPDPGGLVYFNPYDVPEDGIGRPYREAYVERPDGSRASAGIGFWEAPDQTGSWTFWYNASQRRWTDFPVLMGTDMTWAEG